MTGLFGLAFIFAVAIAPRIGVALFLGSTSAGKLTGALALDHVGAFGVPAYPVNPARLLGVGLLALQALCLCAEPDAEEDRMAASCLTCA